jgi:hypothetical protein
MRKRQEVREITADFTGWFLRLIYKQPREDVRKKVRERRYVGGIMEKV